MNIFALFNRPKKQDHHIDRVRLNDGRYARKVRIYMGGVEVSSYYATAPVQRPIKNKTKKTVFLSDL